MIAALATNLNLTNGKLLKSTAAEEKSIGKNVDRRENIGKNPVDVSVVAKEFIYVGTMNMIRLCSYKNIDMDDTITQFEHEWSYLNWNVGGDVDFSNNGCGYLGFIQIDSGVFFRFP